MSLILRYISGLISLVRAGNGVLRSLNCRISEGVLLGKSLYVNNSCLIGDIEIGDNCKLYHCDISGDVRIGRYSSIYGPGTAIHAKLNEITIGSFCSIAKNVQIIEYNHFLNKPSTYYVNQNIFGSGINNDVTSSGPIVIGHDVWIGVNSVILSGVKVGDGAVIAAGSVVTKDVPDFAIIAGNPGRVVKFRFEDTVILEIKRDPWWNKDISNLRKQAEYFNTFLD